MGKFKVGDVVKRTLDVQSYCLCQGSPVGVVTSVGSMGWLQIDGWSDTSGNTHPWSPAYFVLTDEQTDDPLPPAPASALYFNSETSKGDDQRLKVYASIDGCVDIMVIPRTNSPASKAVSVRYGLGVGLHPDDALQLAHDIRRMAMALKRKEKE